MTKWREIERSNQAASTKPPAGQMNPIPVVTIKTKKLSLTSVLPHSMSTAKVLRLS